MTLIQKSTLKFCKDLTANNNKPWFEKNKEKYKEAQANVKAFMAEVEAELNKIDEIEKTKLFRVYRDVRFSKDKTPYNPDFRMAFTRAGAERRGGFFIKVGSGEQLIAAGFWRPEPKDLKLIREHIAQDSKPLEKILKAKKFKDCFGELEGEKVKTAPKGFDKEHPAIDLLRHKGFVVSTNVTQATVCSKDFMKEIIKTYKTLRPFYDYMSDILTHDLNGRSLLKK